MIVGQVEQLILELLFQGSAAGADGSWRSKHLYASGSPFLYMTTLPFCVVQVGGMAHIISLQKIIYHPTVDIGEL